MKIAKMIAILCAALVFVSACGGGGGGGTANYKIGGSVNGLAGSGLVLEDNGGDDLGISSNGTFTFTTSVANGGAYNVSVKTQPSNPSQTCTASSNSGTISGADVTNVSVVCSTNAYTVGGTVSGLTGSGLVLQDNAGDDLAVSADGAFAFATPVADGAGYAVTVKTQPANPSETCTASNNSGTIAGADVTNVSVVCSEPPKASAPGFTKTIDRSADTTASGEFSPGGYKHWQVLYPASDINGSGKLTGIAIQYQDVVAAAVTCPQMTVKLSQTVLSSLTPTFANNVNTGQGGQVTVLDNAPVTFPTGTRNDWAPITFTTPFDYNGRDNLVVEFELAGGGCDATLPEDTQTGLGYTAAVWSFVIGGAKGSTGQWAEDMRFLFAGGDNVVTAADRAGDNANTFAPASTGRTQFLVLASDINGSGPITGIQFKPYSALTSSTTATYTITLSHVAPATTQLGSGTFADNTGTNATTVAQNVAVNLPVGTTEWWVPLSGSFNYDGKSNLLVDVSATVANGFGVAYQNTTDGAVVRIVESANPAAAIGIPYSGRTFEPKLRFNGGQVIVMPPVTPAVSSQALGGESQGGQIQSLYRNDLLGTSGTIRNVYVRLSSLYPVTAVTLTNYKVYMGHTTKQSYSTADTYASNMDENALVYSGTLAIPAGLTGGDWVKIPLTSPFVYDSTKNLSILFTTDEGAAGSNYVNCHGDANQFSSASVITLNNAGGTGGTPGYVYNGMVDVAIDLEK